MCLCRDSGADDLREYLPPFGELCFVFPFASPKYNIEIYGTIILSVALHGCETRSLTLREERRPKVFEMSVLKKIFAPTRHEVAGEWRRLRNDEVYYMCSSPNINRVKTCRRMRWMGYIARAGREEEMYMGLWKGA